MTDNNIYGTQKKQQASWIYKVFLYISFVWISIYPVTSTLTGSFYMGFGDLLNLRGDAFASASMLVFAEALISWIVFEFIFYIYRWFLGFKIYSFIVPSEKLKVDTRLYFTYRNIFFGLFINLCFLYPFLSVFAEFASLVTTLITLMVYANHLNKTYAEPIVGHFVFKCFCYPVFIYEALTIISRVLEVLA